MNFINILLSFLRIKKKGNRNVNYKDMKKNPVDINNIIMKRYYELVHYEKFSKVLENINTDINYEIQILNGGLRRSRIIFYKPITMAKNINIVEEIWEYYE